MCLQQAAEESKRAGEAMKNVGDWDNKLADGMLPLEKEAEAFGETTPEPQYNKPSANTSEAATE